MLVCICRWCDIRKLIDSIKVFDKTVLRQRFAFINNFLECISFANGNWTKWWKVPWLRTQMTHKILAWHFLVSFCVGFFIRKSLLFSALTHKNNSVEKRLRRMSTYGHWQRWETKISTKFWIEISLTKRGESIQRSIEKRRNVLLKWKRLAIWWPRHKYSGKFIVVFKVVDTSWTATWLFCRLPSVASARFPAYFLY